MSNGLFENLSLGKTFHNYKLFKHGSALSSGRIRKVLSISCFLRIFFIANMRWLMRLELFLPGTCSRLSVVEMWGVDFQELGLSKWQSYKIKLFFFNIKIKEIWHGLCEQILIQCWLPFSSGP